MKNKRAISRSTSQQKVDRLLAQLPTMERVALEQLWREVFDRAPDSRLHRGTMIPILAYRVQERAFGGLKESTARKLRGLSDEHECGAKHFRSSLRPKIGTRYVREYKGKMHEVAVLEMGYEYEGRDYRSLTEVAKVITGSKRSGPVFFGLKSTVRMTLA